METSKKNIVVIGSSNVDMVVKGERIPKPGETIIGGDFHKAAGGKGANQAVAAARAGGDVTFIASVGDDIFGREAINGYQKDGINTEHIKVDPDHPTGTALILVDAKGENSIAVASGANANLSESDLSNTHRVIENSDIILMQLETPVKTIEAAAEMARRSGIKVILNPAPAQKLSDNLLAQVSILTPNETETEILSGIEVTDENDARRAAKILMDKGVEIVMITMGKRGVFLYTQEESRMIPAFQVEAVDTTAAGDTFNGALAVAIAEGKSMDEAIRFANAAGAISVTRMGAQPSTPYREEIEKMMHVTA